MSGPAMPAVLAGCTPDGVGWSAFEHAYREVFAPAAQEPLARVRERAAAGRYRVTVAMAEPSVVAGFAIVDRVPSPAYAVLTFVGVREGRRGRGLGARLVQRAAAGIRETPLLVEAAPGAEGLYAAAGFRSLALDYRVPVFGGEGAQAHTLMILQAGDIVDGPWLRAVVEDMFIDGYGVAAGDARLARQLAGIGATVELSPC
ncbi:GNAT family N-acetyltransferase [Spiribacter halobius]|uniref:N-acetyltransferase domain-containing protein n=1 Tax=Sediminicurvatus halobius TaxID=2182432 RepID=A0A2U2N2C8_9GAMM|nr:GNAT family N-acetyltransferase [Spiribacter halobius]PWG63217.1 hypothetical protein DEM34_09065 [Spiribacter halobius]UEX76713.1 GNAT family N-acetyltransferase [Spiribacter halobius]